MIEIGKPRLGHAARQTWGSHSDRSGAPGWRVAESGSACRRTNLESLSAASVRSLGHYLPFKDKCCPTHRNHPRSTSSVHLCNFSSEFSYAWSFTTGHLHAVKVLSVTIVDISECRLGERADNPLPRDDMI
jgi:hypothetical protein